MEEINKILSSKRHIVQLNNIVSSCIEQSIDFPILPIWRDVALHKEEGEMFIRTCSAEHIKINKIIEKITKEKWVFSKNYPTLLYSLLCALDKHFALFTEKEQDKYVLTVYQVMCIALVKENYNRILRNLSLKRFAISKLEHFILNFKTIVPSSRDPVYLELFYAYISEFWNINIILINHNKYRFIGRYCHDRKTALIFKNTDLSYQVLLSNKNLSLFGEPYVENLIDKLNRDNIKPIFSQKEEFILKSMSSYNLEELQELSKLYNISTHKISAKTGKSIRRTKKELFENLQKKM